MLAKDLRDRLLAVTPRIYPHVIPAGKSLPAIAYYAISVPRDVTQTGRQMMLVNAQYQIDIIDTDYDNSLALLSQAVALLNGTSGWGSVKASRVTTTREDYDQETGLFRQQIDASFEYLETP